MRLYFLQMANRTHLSYKITEFSFPEEMALGTPGVNFNNALGFIQITYPR